jgi:hypothetical protein
MNAMHAEARERRSRAASDVSQDGRPSILPAHQCDREVVGGLGYRNIRPSRTRTRAAVGVATTSSVADLDRRTVPIADGTADDERRAGTVTSEVAKSPVRRSNAYGGWNRDCAGLRSQRLKCS